MVASLILMVALPLQVASGASAAATWFVWLPMLVLKLLLAAWLIVPRGDRPPIRSRLAGGLSTASISGFAEVSEQRRLVRGRLRGSGYSSTS